MMNLPIGAHAQVHQKTNVTQRNYDAMRTGWNWQETTLNVANVGSSSFKQVAQVLNLDGQIDAQPLLVTGQSITGQNGIYDVLYVATENNTVYALDASTGAILTQRNLGAPVSASLLAGGACHNNPNSIGIASTPAIDTSTNTMYVITFGVESGSPTYRLHALDLSTLADTVPAVAVAATHTLSNGTTYTFSGTYSRQRSALLLANGNVYAGFASYCDLRPDASRGWLLGWQTGTLQPLPTAQLTNQLQPDPVKPKGTGFFLTSIWMSGSGAAADASGNVFFVTGNSDSNRFKRANSAQTSYQPPLNLQESVVKLSPALDVVDYFTPGGSTRGVTALDPIDSDFGAGGITLLPDQPGSVPQIAVAAGKNGVMYLLNRQNLGLHSASGPDHVLGSFQIGGCWCAQSFFFGADGLGRVVSSGGSKVIVWKVQTSPSVTLISEHTSPALYTGQDAGFLTSISSNGNTAGTAIICAVARPSTKTPPASLTKGVPTLYAFDASTGTQLFAGVAGAWPNTGGNANIVPVVANGMVYVASYAQLNIFGLSQGSSVVSAAGVAPPSPQLATDALYGTITQIMDSEFSVKTRTGRTVRVDGSAAVAQNQSVQLFVGEPVTVTGSVDRSGKVHADAIVRAKPEPESWPDVWPPSR